MSIFRSGNACKRCLEPFGGPSVILLPVEIQVLYLITGQSRKGLAFSRVSKFVPVYKKCAAMTRIAG